MNIRYDAPREVWRKVAQIYEQLPGWLGYDGVPYWFGKNDDGGSKMVSASVEPAGLQVSSYMEDDEWAEWLGTFTRMASAALGYAVGDVRDGYE